MRFSALGDVLQTLPILSMLKEGFPNSKIGWAIDAGLAPIVEGHPALDYIHLCHRNSWTKRLSNPTQWATIASEMGQYVDEVKAVGYDVAIDAQGLFKTAILPAMAGIPRRIGYGHGRELSTLFYNERHLNLKEYFDPAVFHLEHMAVLARAVGASKVTYAIEPPVVSQETEQKMASLIESGFTTKAPIVAMAPGTQWHSKCWPEEHWVALIDQLLENSNYNLLLVGSPGDSQLVARVLQAFPTALRSGRVFDVSGKTSVREMYALYKHVTAAIGSDSAPLHIAGAVKVPILVGIYGPTGYRRTPPIGSAKIKLLSTEGTLSCQPCHKKVCPLGTKECMVMVSADEVYATLIEAMADIKSCESSNIRAGG